MGGVPGCPGAKNNGPGIYLDRKASKAITRSLFAAGAGNRLGLDQPVGRLIFDYEIQACIDRGDQKTKAFNLLYAEGQRERKLAASHNTESTGARTPRLLCVSDDRGP